MIKSCGVDRWLGGLQDFSVSPSPLGTNWVLELIGTWFGLGQGVLGLSVWGRGLTIKRFDKLHLGCSCPDTEMKWQSFDQNP